MKSLHIHFGPIQPFIASARTTRDLWAGSFLLSTLSLEALSKVESTGATIIRPQVATLKDNSSTGFGDIKKRIGLCPNYFEIEVEDSEVQSVANAAFTGWNNFWSTVTSNVLDLIESKVKIDETFHEIWDRQVSNLWEQYWAVGGYMQLRRRKSARSFDYSAEPGEKCTLCGNREVLHLQDGSRRGIRSFWSDLSKKLGPHILKQDGVERLCAVCLTKRNVMNILSKLSKADNIPFPSTASFATIIWRLMLLSSDNQDLQKAIAEFLKALKDNGVQPLSHLWCAKLNGKIPLLLNYEGDYFLSESYDTDKIPDLTESARNALRSSFANLMKVVRVAGFEDPPSYFAVLSMDGDGMGQLLQDNPDMKNELSAIMAEFAKSVPGIIEKQWGRVVYAGGDDVLAVLPPSDALRIAKRVRDKFTEIMQSLQGLKRVPTISAGIVLAPLTMPLQTVVGRSHYLLEEIAKGHVVPNSTSTENPREKDAFAIEVWDRGGPNLRFVKKWDRDEDSSWVDEIYELADRLSKNHEVPLTNSFLYSCADLLNRQAVDVTDAEVIEKLLTADYLRSRDERISKLKETPDGLEKATKLIHSLLEIAQDDTRKQTCLVVDHILMLRFFANSGRLIS
ncbi:MAG: type III-B CRISPR-associated protein Cas10/Cmr2 [Candidatus Thorarchaeota archaeon]|nr:type III-B CRISPR-associated protein Cas10/Cmr2 [Candidatus Thorarchaeota archaeon]